MFKILRFEQWSKNLVLFLPALFAKKFELLLDKNLLIIFLGFSIVASSTYIFNDLKDLDQDRLHPTKKNRPLPKGDISVKEKEQNKKNELFNESKESELFKKVLEKFPDANLLDIIPKDKKDK